MTIKHFHPISSLVQKPRGSAGPNPPEAHALRLCAALGSAGRCGGRPDPLRVPRRGGRGGGLGGDLGR